MRKLIVIVLVLALVWAGYWVIGAQTVERGLRNWIAARVQEDWVAGYSDISTAGFPNRFDTTISNIELADPSTGIAWSAPFFQILALSYRPNHIIAVWPHEQTVSTPYQKLTLNSQQMRGSVIFEPGTALTLDHSTFVLDNFNISSSMGWQARMEQARFATRQTTVVENAHDIGFEATGFRPSDAFRRSLDPIGALPEELETLKIDATAEFTAPWNRFAVEDARPQVEKLDLKLLQATWGDLDLRVAGEVTVDDEGIPTGRIVVKATNWSEMLDIAVAGGAVPEPFAPTIRSLLEVVAGLSGQPDTIDAPLTFEDGRVSFGPLPLGPAPRLVLR